MTPKTRPAIAALLALVLVASSGCALLRSVTKTPLDTFVASHRPDAVRGASPHLLVMGSPAKQKIAYVAFPVPEDDTEDASGTLSLHTHRAGFDLAVHDSGAFTNETGWATRPALQGQVGAGLSQSDAVISISLDDVRVHDGWVFLAVTTSSRFELYITSLEGAAEAGDSALAPTLDLTTPPRGPPIARGVTVSGGWSSVSDFEARTSPLPVEMIRAFPAGRVLGDSLRQVDGAIARYPDAGVYWSTFMAGRNFSDAEVSTFAQQIRDRADQLPWLDIAVDAEPDRVDRGYTDAQFIAGYQRLHAAVGPHPKIRWVLNLTGYLFLDRVDRYLAVLPITDVLAVDPYWKQSLRPDQVQAGELDTVQAAEWARARGLAFAWGEWGAEQGSNQVTNLHRAFDLAERTLPDRLPYFQNVGSTGSPFTTVLASDAAWAAYTERAIALG